MSTTLAENPSGLSELDALPLRLTPTASLEDIAAVQDRIKFAEELIREVRKRVDSAMIELVEDRGEITIGTIRYYVGDKPVTKCPDVPAALEALLQATVGDLEKVAEFLSSQPVKHGACRSLFDEATYARLFVTTKEPEIREGKPVKKLQRIDTAFVR